MMVCFRFLLLISLQIIIAKTYSFQDDIDVARRYVDQPAEANSMDAELGSLSESEQDAEREGGEYKEEENLGSSHFIEGDIYIDKTPISFSNKRDALTNTVRLWPGGKVPFKFGYVSSRVKSAFQRAIKDYNKYTCIRIVPRTSEASYIYVVSEGGCWSSIGKGGRRQKLSLGRGCEYKGVAIHELMHALGFYHEQSRLDRDNYVRIKWGNIVRGMDYNFKKYPHGQADTLGEPYDYASIMHYPKRAFSRNGQDTIEQKRSGPSIGQRSGFSRIDIKQINKLYKCNGVVLPTNRPTKPGPCIDKKSGCPRWANKYNYCVSGSYIAYMKRNCRKSCKLCKGTGQCIDKKSGCPRWANKHKYCVSGPYIPYMKRNCRKSCKLCKGTGK